MYMINLKFYNDQTLLIRAILFYNINSSVKSKHCKIYSTMCLN
jgi:hypothetical protein